MICRECRAEVKPRADSPLAQFPATWICGRCQDLIDQMIRDEINYEPDLEPVDFRHRPAPPKDKAE